MPLRIGDDAPDFTAETTEGTIKFHEWIGDGWAILFSHPKDFTPVCTTELGYMAKLKPEFDKRNTKVIGLSIDPVSDHKRWVGDIEETQGYKVNYPMIGDPDLTVAKLYDMIHPNASGAAPRTAADNATIRSVFIVGPDKKIKLILTYPMSTGRNFDEVLRVLDSMQLTAKHKVATPVNWKQGEDVIIVPSVSNDEAKVKFPGRLEGAEAVPADRAAAQIASIPVAAQGAAVAATVRSLDDEWRPQRCDCVGVRLVRRGCAARRSAPARGVSHREPESRALARARALPDRGNRPGGRAPRLSLDDLAEPGRRRAADVLRRAHRGSVAADDADLRARRRGRRLRHASGAMAGRRGSCRRRRGAGTDAAPRTTRVSTRSTSRRSAGCSQPAAVWASTRSC